MEKLLEDAQIKLSVVASDIFGVSGREMMAALISGQTSPKALAQLARGRMRAKLDALEEAFTGHFTDHHAMLLKKILACIDGLNADIAELDAAPLVGARTEQAAIATRKSTVVRRGHGARAGRIARRGLDAQARWKPLANELDRTHPAQPPRCARA